MGCCSALNCSNSSEKNFRMFRFPSDQERRKKWIENSRREGWTPGPNAQLCSVHFEESQFELHRQDGWKKLKPNAIPTLFPEPAVPKVKRVKGAAKRKRSPSEENEVSPKKKYVRKKSSQESSAKRKKLKKGLKSKSRVVSKKKSFENSQNDGQKKKQGSSDSSQNSQKENVSPRLRKSQRPRKIATPPASAQFEECQFQANSEGENMWLKPEAIPTLFMSSEMKPNVWNCEEDESACSEDNSNGSSVDDSADSSDNDSADSFEDEDMSLPQKSSQMVENQAFQMPIGKMESNQIAIIEGDSVSSMAFEGECGNSERQINEMTWNRCDLELSSNDLGSYAPKSSELLLTSYNVVTNQETGSLDTSFEPNNYILREMLSLKESNAALSSENESLKLMVTELESHSNEMVKENELMLEEIQEFMKNNRSMSKVILELEKHNKIIATQLEKFKKRKRKMAKRVRKLKEKNKCLLEKLKYSYSEEQLSQLDKLKSLGTIERYLPE